MSLLSWLLPAAKFYVAQHHGGGTVRHGPYPMAKAKAVCESFGRSGFSSWIENKNGPRFRSPYQPDFRPVDCRKEPPHA